MIIIALFIFYYAKNIEPKCLVSKYYNLDLGFKIVAFSDTHFGKYYNESNMKKIVNKINTENADYVFFLGDLYDRYNLYKKGENEISNGLKNIKAKKGKFAIIGNHDEGRNNCKMYIDMMENSDFKVLVNKIVNIENTSIYGLDDIFYGEFIDKTAELKENNFNILLLHTGDEVDNIDMSKVDLTLSGHTHNGQINIPLLKKMVMPYGGKKYTYGKYKINNGNLIVSKGIGMTRLPYRLGSRPEIVIIK